MGAQYKTTGVWKILITGIEEVLKKIAKTHGGECGIDFAAIRTRYYFRGTILEVIQNREGVSQKIREIILGRKKIRGGSLQSRIYSCKDII